MMKRIKIYSAIAVMMSAVFISSCSEKALDEVNANPNNPANVQARFILTDVMTSTAFSAVGGDVSLYSSVYLEHEAGVWGQTFNAETRVGEPTQATTYNNSWNAIYANIKFLKIVIAKTSGDGAEAGNDVTCGIAKVLLAYNLGVLTDFFGDTPFSESGIIDANGSPTILQPKIDKQSDLYPQIQTLLDEAIVLLDGTDALTAIGGQDLIYGGDKALWKKAAYGLKARYLMHTLKISTDVDADMTNVVDYISNSFEDASEQMQFDNYDGASNLNPLFGYSNARDGLGVSASLANKFKELEDPRGEQAFMEYTSWFAKISLDDAIDGAVPNGEPIQQQYTYPLSVVDYAATAPTMLLSYHELMFLKAEALARLNQTADAKEALETAVVSAFANLQNTLEASETYIEIGFEPALTESAATTYFDAKVSGRFDTNPLKEIMLQKYLAFYGASGEATEAFNDYRRLKAMGEEDFIALENPLNADTKFPLRFTYGNSDVSANPNVKAAYGDGNYVYTENVWWAGGTR